MRHLALAAFLAATPLRAFAQDPAPATDASAAATQAEIDALLAALDMETTFRGVMTQMETAQQQVLRSSFGHDLSQSEQKAFDRAQAEATAIVHKHLSWDVLKPLVEKVYGQAFTGAEIRAMTAFYTTPEGASILKKMPQVMALTMEAIQPATLAAIQEIQANQHTSGKP